MAWSNPRSSRVPPNWKAIKRRILARDNYVCQLRGPSCIGVATQVDHKDRLGPSTPDNLWAVCAPCHQVKTSSEATEGRNRYYARKYRPIETHPGSI